MSYLDMLDLSCFMVLFKLVASLLAYGVSLCKLEKGATLDNQTR